MKAFITGSHAYGTPHPDSDIDIVIRVDPDVANMLRSNHTEGSFGSIKAGNLDIILCETDKEYEAWSDATSLLIKKKPVTKDTAIQIIEKMLGLARIIDSYDKNRMAVDIQYLKAIVDFMEEVGKVG